jgi:ribose 5-phosphate isomerase B
MRIAIGADHGGYVLKGDIVALLQQAGHQVVDVGAHTLDSSDDYPDFTRLVGEAIQRGEVEREPDFGSRGVRRCEQVARHPRWIVP